MELLLTEQPAFGGADERTKLAVGQRIAAGPLRASGREDVGRTLFGFGPGVGRLIVSEDGLGVAGVLGGFNLAGQLAVVATEHEDLVVEDRAG